MKRSDVLKQKRASKIEEQGALLETRKAEKRDKFTEEETTKFNALDEEIRGLDTEITQAETEEAAELRAASQKEGGSRSVMGKKDGKEGGEAGEKRSLAQRVSLVKAIRSVSKGGNLEGAEAEMDALGREENRNAGVETPENAKLTIPLYMLRATAQTVSEDSGNYGGQLVVDQAPRVQMAFQPTSVLEELGVTLWDNLQGGDIPLPVLSAYAFEWLTETEEITIQKQLIQGPKLNPNRLGAAVEISNRLLAQSSIPVENTIKNMLRIGFENAICAAAINGSGVGPEPLGVLNNVNVPQSSATSAVIPTKAIAAELARLVKSANSSKRNLKYLGSALTEFLLDTTLLDAGSGKFLKEEVDRLLGYPFVSSNQIPQLNDGADVNDVLIFGDWSQMFVGQWGSMSILTDPYSASLKNSVRLVVNGHADVAIAQPTAFAVNKFLNAEPAP